MLWYPEQRKQQIPVIYSHPRSNNNISSMWRYLLLLLMALVVESYAARQCAFRATQPIGQLHALFDGAQQATRATVEPVQCLNEAERVAANLALNLGEHTLCPGSTTLRWSVQLSYA